MPPETVLYLEISEGYERATCSQCGKRRMCRFICYLGLPGIGWMLCREHESWRPVMGRDFEVVAE